MVCWYAVPVTPLGRVAAVVIVKIGAIVSENAFAVERLGKAAIPAGGVAVTVTLKLKTPLAVGLPLRTFPLSCKPGGSLSMDHV